jgi:hypothetical protein
MAGCFGNHPVDRYLEKQLDEYLKQDIENDGECFLCKEIKDLNICEKCERYYCEEHSSKYNQFSQIDYDCCCECQMKIENP